MVDLPHRKRVAQRTGDGADILGRQAENGPVLRRDVVVLRGVLLQPLGGAEEERPARDERTAERSTVQLALELRLRCAALLGQGILRVQARVAEEPVASAGEQVGARL